MPLITSRCLNQHIKRKLFDWRSETRRNKLKDKNDDKEMWIKNKKNCGLFLVLVLILKMLFLTVDCKLLYCNLMKENQSSHTMIKSRQVHFWPTKKYS